METNYVLYTVFSTWCIIQCICIANLVSVTGGALSRLSLLQSQTQALAVPVPLETLIQHHLLQPGTDCISCVLMASTCTLCINSYIYAGHTE